MIGSAPVRALTHVCVTQPNVAGIILAGSADFKTELSQSDLFDIRCALTGARRCTRAAADAPRDP